MDAIISIRNCIISASPFRGEGAALAVDGNKTQTELPSWPDNVKLLIAAQSGVAAPKATTHGNRPSHSHGSALNFCVRKSTQHYRSILLEPLPKMFFKKILF
jgi:hypothetical protein